MNMRTKLRGSALLQAAANKGTERVCELLLASGALDRKEAAQAAVSSKTAMIINTWEHVSVFGCVLCALVVVCSNMVD